jgi:LacI family transcriptional regulator
VQSIAQFLFIFALKSARMARHQTTIHDIARYLKVSASTVSRALANHPRISRKTREEVARAARELNYRPNRLASSLRKGTGNTIGVIIPIINRHFFANIIHGIERVASENDFSVIICQSDERLEKEKENIQTLIKNRVSGILISVSSESTSGDHFRAIRSSNIPVVMFDRSLEDLQISKVINDDFLGAYNATSHLIEQGYRHICHFSGPLHIYSYQQRYEGYRKALQEHGIPYLEELLFPHVISRERGYMITADLLNRSIGFDAIFAASDMSALGALLCVKEHQIPIPDRIGIIGYVNEPFTEFVEPALSSIEQYGEKIGESSAQLLIKQIKQNSADKPEIVSVPPALIIRKSSSRKPAQF